MRNLMYRIAYDLYILVGKLTGRINANITEYGKTAVLDGNYAYYDTMEYIICQKCEHLLSSLMGKLEIICNAYDHHLEYVYEDGDYS